MLFNLKDRALNYDRKSIRANALTPGNVILIDGAHYPVISVNSSRIIPVDDSSAEVLRKVREVASEDKVSPNFDDAIAVTVAMVTLKERGGEDLGVEGAFVEKILYFSEWETVDILV